MGIKPIPFSLQTAIETLMAGAELHLPKHSLVTKSSKNKSGFDIAVPDKAGGYHLFSVSVTER